MPPTFPFRWRQQTELVTWSPGGWRCTSVAAARRSHFQCTRSELGMSGTEANEVAAEEEDARPDGLLPPPALRPGTSVTAGRPLSQRAREGATYLQIVVDRFGIKDAERYIAPFLTVSVHGMRAVRVRARASHWSPTRAWPLQTSWARWWSLHRTHRLRSRFGPATFTLGAR